jgi:hypothetical protein
MRKPLSLLVFVLLVLAALTVVNPMSAQSVVKDQQPLASEEGATPDAQSPVRWLQQFVPDWRPFWDDSKNWTTNYGPAYRTTVLNMTNFLACSSQFALCFHSGPDPYPCHISPDGRSADCLCTVGNSTNYTLITAILNHDVYEATVSACKADGRKCNQMNPAPVCQYLPGGALIPGADVISTYDPESLQEIIKAVFEGNAGLKHCPKGPYAGCMTAPCKLNTNGTANCKCPVFYGEFQLTGNNAKCSLGGDLIPSASYNPGK